MKSLARARRQVLTPACALQSDTICWGWKCSFHLIQAHCSPWQATGLLLGWDSSLPCGRKVIDLMIALQNWAAQTESGQRWSRSYIKTRGTSLQQWKSIPVKDENGVEEARSCFTSQGLLLTVPVLVPSPSLPAPVLCPLCATCKWGAPGAVRGREESVGTLGGSGCANRGCLEGLFLFSLLTRREGGNTSDWTCNHLVYFWVWIQSCEVIWMIL